jgi:protein-arginine kinase activator protein McsA
MRCDLCKRLKATVHVTQDPTPMPGEIIRIHLCSRCAHKYGLDDPFRFALDDLLRALGKKISTPDSP